MNEFDHRYDDIIALPHPDPQRPPRMARAERAAERGIPVQGMVWVRAKES